MLGFSVYLNNINEVYIKKMLNYGFTTIFTSLQIPEDRHDDIFQSLRRLKALVGQDAMIIVDINPKLFDVIQSMDRDDHSGFDALRFDESVRVEAMIEWGQHSKIVLNASTDALSILEQLHGKLDLSQVIVAHNYYPRPETGLEAAYFYETNKKIKKLFPDVLIMAFVCGSELRGPVFKGLPTLENHRDLHSIVAYQSLKDMHVDLVCIGDLSITDKLMHQFDAYVNDETVVLSSIFEVGYEYIATMLHINRLDVSRDVVRADSFRKEHHHHVVVKNNVDRKMGAITLDNHLYGRYMNELQVTRVHLPQNDAINVIGHVHYEDLPLIQLIRSGTKFKFVRSDACEY